MTIQSFNCVLVGSDSLLAEAGKLIQNRGHDIVAVVTNEPRIAAWARTEGIALIADPMDLSTQVSDPFDYLFSIANLQIIPDEVLAIPRAGAINFHDGPLPEYAGLNVPSWALIRRERSHAVTWHEMTARVDEGSILRQKRFELEPDETSLSINAQCFEAGLASFSELLGDLESAKLTPTPQHDGRRENFGRHQRPDSLCLLNWNRDSLDLEALVRALHFGPYDNPLGVAKLGHAGHCVAVVSARSIRGDDGAGPMQAGTIVDLDADGIVVAAANGHLLMEEFRTLEGLPLAAEEVARLLGLSKGTVLDAAASEFEDRARSVTTRLSQSEHYWIDTLWRFASPAVPYVETARNTPSSLKTLRIATPARFDERFADLATRSRALTSLLACYVARLSGQWSYRIGYRDQVVDAEREGLEAFLADEVALRVDLMPEISFTEAFAKLDASIARIRDAGPFLRDIRQRYTRLSSVSESDLAVSHRMPLEEEVPEGRVLTQIVTNDGCIWLYDANRLDEQAAYAMREQFQRVVDQAAEDPSLPIAKADLLTPDQRAWLAGLNQTHAPFAEETIHQAFEKQVARTPDSEALHCRGRSLSFAKLNAQANQLAAELVASGVGPDRLVGVHLPRSPDLVVAVFAVLKAGGAYVPMDPTYPRERIRYMIEDSGSEIVITTSSLANGLDAGVRCICVDRDDNRMGSHPEVNSSKRSSPSDLAYVIYTSGSTGKPKGVMVEHRNVSGFFAGMDERLDHDPPGVWLAVTSLSFDISVLELLWTLSRGFKVVLHSDSPLTAGSRSIRPIDFSLFLWGSDSEASRDKYELMVNAARFADLNDFTAVWTPERHFHAFGGPYPNPSVTSAAIAAITRSVQIRAGSCVLPLHHPVRVAEEWAVVDNLSNGRAAISFASGWQPNDFLFRPENFENAKNVMMRDIGVVRALWRGEAVKFPGPFGTDVEVVTQPRPVQPELPFWITTAGNPDTFRMAGASGANLLTHLLGQTVDELGEKIQAYREARADAGFDPETGYVSLMLHAYVGSDDEEVREIVREPMKSYLASATSLLKEYAWTFPAFKRPKGAESVKDVNLAELADDEMDAILEHAFSRYLETSGLFGTVRTCLERIAQLEAIGVNDVACMIDFGVPVDQVLGGLDLLDELRAASQDQAVASAIHDHEITHLQCTPSMARQLLSDPQTREALSQLRHLMIGGEAFPPGLAADLCPVVSGRITNMYGPTETTIWSSTDEINVVEKHLTIGRPIANTQFFVVDALGNLQPPGVPGELWIGGVGVVRGYHGQARLTADRFVDNPFADDPPRLYRTGDLVRTLDDGRLEFISRLDHQVKIRGYRVELGEIESLLEQLGDIAQAVVILREDKPGDQRLVAYIVPAGAAVVSTAALEENLQARLPDFMVPKIWVTVDAFPQTPNGKIDVNALPPPEYLGRGSDGEYVAPRDELEQAIANVWQDELQVDRVGALDDFFDLGGHSLLAAMVIQRLRAQFEIDLSLATLFRLSKPTVEMLAKSIEESLLNKIDAMTDEEARSLLQSE